MWAPIHAMRASWLIGPAEAAEPLLECMEWEDGWFEELAGVYGRIGPAAIPLLRSYLYDTERDLSRRVAPDALTAITQSHSGRPRRGEGPCSPRPGPAHLTPMQKRKHSLLSSSATWAI